jgi:hypothetical protein
LNLKTVCAGQRKAARRAAILLCSAALLLSVTGCMSVFGGEDVPEEVDWENMEFDESAVRARRGSDPEAEEEWNPTESSQDAIAHFTTQKNEARAEKARLEEELREINKIAEILAVQEPELVERYELLAENTRKEIKMLDEEIQLANEMIQAAQLAIDEYERLMRGEETYIPPDNPPPDNPDEDEPHSTDADSEGIKEPITEEPDEPISEWGKWDELDEWALPDELPDPPPETIPDSTSVIPDDEPPPEVPAENGEPQTPSDDIGDTQQS